ncbi:MAG TPA: hypothetical protein DDW82_00725 [Acholeplasmataceae bacterium]|nr:hypothetical protein [Acholeplasmataceae bacterium]HCB66048.1 hypothetical protein [Acholeplasmataceae bacterium]
MFFLEINNGIMFIVRKDDEMNKLYVAIIGYGMAGRLFHLPPLLGNPMYVVKYIMTNNEQTIQELKSNYPSIEIIHQIEEALTDQKIDLMVIATPNDVHYAYTEMSLLAGKHVVCEKPFVESLQQANFLFELAARQKKILRVFHNRQYDGDILTIHELIKQNPFGRIFSMTARFDFYSPQVQPRWRERPGVMPGKFYDLAPHLIDHVIRLFGLPKSLQMKTYKDREGALVDDHFEMEMYYEGLTCYLGAGQLFRNPLPRFQIDGTNASYYKYGFDQPDVNYLDIGDSYQSSGLRSELYTSQHEKVNIPILIGKHYLFYDKLAKDIQNNITQDSDKSYALKVVGLMEIAKKSDQINQIIEIPQSFQKL